MAPHADLYSPKGPPTLRILILPGKNRQGTRQQLPGERKGRTPLIGNRPLQERGTENERRVQFGRAELKDGVFTYYSLTGQPRNRGVPYQNDKPEGEYRSYKTTYNMGSDSVWLWRTKNYRDGKLDGSFVTYDQAKRIRRQDLYRADKLVEGYLF